MPGSAVKTLEMTVGLLLTALGLGLRHGVDWDHIAAIADLSGTAENRRRGFVLSMLYALGHALVVFGLGILAIGFGLAIPDSVDTWMGRIVGVTLIALGVWILVELIRKGRNFRLRSRWMLMIDGTFAGFRRVRNRAVRNRATQRFVSIEHEHEHDHSMIDLTDSAMARQAEDDAHAEQHAHDHAHVKTHTHALVEQDHVVAVGASESSVATTTGWRGFRHRSGSAHAHSHRHDLVLPDGADARYGNRTAAGIGMLHGVGIESPTQIAIFVASTSVAGFGFGVMLLTSWVAGLLLSNAVLAALAGAGVLNAERSFPVYATLAVVVSIMSIALGTLYLAGFDVLPEIIPT